MNNFLFLIILISCTSFVALTNHPKKGGSGSSCSPVLSIQNSELPVKVGDEVIIKCRACGDKDTFWFKDGKRLGETNRIHWISAKRVSFFPYVVVEGKLKVKKLRRKDGGLYTCYALDFFTNIMERGDIRLDVKPRHNIPIAKQIKRK